MFLTQLYETGVGYDAIASARSALASVIYIPGLASISDHPLVKRFLKGVANTRPQNPRYVIIWDTSIVIRYLKTLKNEKITFKLLCFKTTMLLALLSGQRVSTLHKLKSKELLLREKEAIFYVSALLKHDKPNRKKEPLIFHKYPHDAQLCPVTLIKYYLNTRNTLVSSEEYLSFFITHGKPHHEASKDTLARWIKETMSLSGIDTSTFKPHSCHSAPRSQAVRTCSS